MFKSLLLITVSGVSVVQGAAFFVQKDDPRESLLRGHLEAAYGTIGTGLPSKDTSSNTIGSTREIKKRPSILGMFRRKSEPKDTVAIPASLPAVIAMPLAATATSSVKKSGPSSVSLEQFVRTGLTPLPEDEEAFPAIAAAPPVAEKPTHLSMVMKYSGITALTHATVAVAGATTRALSATSGATTRAITATTDATAKAFTATTGAAAGAASAAARVITRDPIQILEDAFVKDRTAVTPEQLNHLAHHYISMDHYPCFDERNEDADSDSLPTPVELFNSTNVEKAFIYLTESSRRDDKNAGLKLINYYTNLYFALQAMPPLDATAEYRIVLNQQAYVTSHSKLCVRKLNELIGQFRFEIDPIYVIEANLCLKGIPLYDDIDPVTKGIEILCEASEHGDLLAKFEFGRINLMGLYAQNDTPTALGLLTQCANQTAIESIRHNSVGLIAKYYGDLPNVIEADDYLLALEFAQRGSIEFDNNITYAIFYAKIVLNLHNRNILIRDEFKGNHRTCFNHLKKCVDEGVDADTPMFNEAKSLLGQLAENNPWIASIPERAAMARAFYERAVTGASPDKYAAKRLFIASLNGNLIPLFESSNPADVSKYWALCDLLGVLGVPIARSEPFEGVFTADAATAQHRRPTSDAPVVAGERTEIVRGGVCHDFP